MNNNTVVWGLLGLSVFLVSGCGGGGGSSDPVTDGTPPSVSISPLSGSYLSAQSLTISCSDDTACGDIYFTLDGTDPTAASAVYSAPLDIASNTSLKAVAVDASGNRSDIVSASYIIDMDGPVVSSAVPGGAYNAEQTTSLACDDGSGSGCAAIYYTLDGTDPGSGSTVFSSDISIASDTVLKFLGVDALGNSGTIQTESYVIDTLGPVVSSTVPGGAYNTAQTTSLACDDGSGSGCAAIYYTLDGTDPSTSSTVFSSDISIASDTVLKFLGVDAVGNSGAIQTESYVMDAVAPTVQSIVPAAASNTMAINEAFTINFSEAIDSSSVDATSITVSDGVAPVSGVLTVNADSVVLTPTDNLAFATTYTLTVKASVSDAAGNTMAADYVTSISTMAAPQVISADTYASIADKLSAYDSAGNGLEVWVESNGINTQTLYRYYEAALGSWSVPVALYAGSLSTMNLISNGGDFMLSYSLSSRVYARAFDGANWGVEALVSDSGYGYAPRLSSNGTGYAIVWYYGESLGGIYSNNLYTNIYNGVSWGTATRIESTPDNSYSPVIASNGSGYAVMWYQQNAASAYDLYAATFDGSTWSLPVALETGAATTSAQLLAASATGYAVVWTQNDGTLNRTYANVFNGSSWGGETLLDDATYASSTPTLASNGSGFAVAWYEYDSALADRNVVAAVFDGTSWGAPAILDANTSTIYNIAIVSDGTGYATAWRQYALVGGYNSYHIYANVHDGSTGWAGQTLVEDGSNYYESSSPRLAAGTSGYALSWIQYDPTNVVQSVYANVYSGSAWTTPQLLEASANPITSTMDLMATGSGYRATWLQGDGIGNVHMGSSYSVSSWAAASTHLAPTTGGASRTVKVVQNNAGVILAVWNQYDAGSWKAMRNVYDGANWGVPGVIDGCNAVPDIASNGSGFMLTCTISSSVNVIAFDGINWGSPQVVSTSYPYTAPVISSNGSGYAVTWRAYTSPNYVVNASLFDGTSWGAEELVDIASSYAYPIIGSNGSDYAVSWRAYNSGYDTYASVRTNTGWSASAKLNSAVSYSEDGHAIKGMGAGFTVAWRSSSSIIASSYDAGIWSTPASLESGSSSAYYPKLASNGSDLMAVWGQLGIYANGFNGGSWDMAETKVADAPSSPLVEIASNGTGYGIAWLASDGLANSVYAVQNDGVAWLNRIIVLEGLDQAADGVSITGGATGYRAFWAQPDPSNTVDPAANRVWASAEF